MPHDDAVYLHHILDAIVQIEDYVRGMTQETFVASAITRDAVIRQLDMLEPMNRRLFTYPFPFGSVHNSITRPSSDTRR
jgi:hypothetical protein